jgi:ribosomal protein S20
MKIRSESYPDRIRQIAKELSQVRNSYDVDHATETLRKIADELESKLKKGPLKRA